MKIKLLNLVAVFLTITIGYLIYYSLLTEDVEIKISEVIITEENIVNSNEYENDDIDEMVESDQIIQSDENNDDVIESEIIISNDDVKDTKDVVTSEEIIVDNSVESFETNDTNDNDNIELEKPIIEEEINTQIIEEDEVDTNDIFYSIHLGRIEYTSLEDCSLAGTDLALNNTSEIYYFNCLEIYSTTNKFLGVYLDIVCSSGDCNRFKD